MPPIPRRNPLRQIVADPPGYQLAASPAQAFPRVPPPETPQRPLHPVMQRATPTLIEEMIRQESAGDPTAVSTAGAQGLMQLMPETAAELGVDPMDPAENVEGGRRYINQQLERFGGDLGLALAAYNWGPSNVEAWLERGARLEELPEETSAYMARITNRVVPAPVPARKPGPLRDLAQLPDPTINVTPPRQLAESPQVGNVPTRVTRPVPVQPGEAAERREETPSRDLGGAGDLPHVARIGLQRVNRLLERGNVRGATNEFARIRNNLPPERAAAVEQRLNQIHERRAIPALDERPQAPAAEPAERQVAEAPRPAFVDVEIPDQGVVRFPGEMSPDEIGKAIRRNFPEYQQGLPSALWNQVLQSVFAGSGLVQQGLAGLQTFIAQTSMGEIDDRARYQAALEFLREQQDPDEREAIYNELRARAKQAFPPDTFALYLGNLNRARAGRDDFLPMPAYPQIFDPETKTRERLLYRSGAATQEYGEEAFPVFPENAENWLVQTAGAAGYTVPIFAAAFVNPAAGVATAFTLGSGEATERAVESGASEADVGLAAAMGTVPGSMDYAPVHYFLNRVLQATPQGAAAKVFLAEMAKRAIAQSVIEGTTEGVQEFLQNTIAAITHNPDQDLWENVPQAVKIGASAGLLFGIPGGAIGGARTVREQRGEPEAVPEPRPREPETAEEVARGVEELREAVADERPVEEIREADEAAAAAAQKQAEEAPQKALEQVAEAAGFPTEVGQTVEVTFPDGGVETARIESIEPGRTVTDQPRIRLVDPESGEPLYDGDLFALTGMRLVEGSGTQDSPAAVQQASDVERAGEQVEPPTPAQAEAGNYRKGHVRFQGFDISIETPKGGTRTGMTAEGRPWSVEMPAHYGYIRRSEAADGDQLDVYLGDDVESQTVFVVDQVDPATGEFDEHKAVLGVRDLREAEELYRSGFSDGRGGSRLGAITEMSVPEFQTWVKQGDLKKPLAYEKPAPRPSTELIGVPLYHASTTRAERVTFENMEERSGAIWFALDEEIASETVGTKGHEGLVVAKLRPGSRIFDPNQDQNIREVTFEKLARAHDVSYDDAKSSFLNNEKNGETWENIDNIYFLNSLRNDGFDAVVATEAGETTIAVLNKHALERVDLKSRPAAEKPVPVRPAASQPEPAEPPARQPQVATPAQPQGTVSHETPARVPVAARPEELEQPDMLGARTRPGSQLSLRQRAIAYIDEQLGEDQDLDDIAEEAAFYQDQADADGFWRVVLAEVRRRRRAEARGPAERARKYEETRTRRPGRTAQEEAKTAAEGVIRETEAKADIKASGATAGLRQAAGREDLVNAFRDRFKEGGGFKTITQARQFAKQRGSQLSEKEIDEAAEAGAVLAAREAMPGWRGLDDTEVFNRLVQRYNAQPGLNVRSSDSAARQAYSTPMPVAYVAAQQAGIDRESTVYEPTAGHGALLLTAEPGKVLANELDPGRRRSLERAGFEVAGEDATDFEPGRKFDVVIMNPPFGADPSGEGRRYPIWDTTTTKIDHGIAAKALESMKDDGRAVLLIAGQRAERGYATQGSLAFLKQLYDRYNVVDHFTIDGDLYTRQGAGWPIDVIVIRGRGKSQLPLPSKRKPRVYSAWEELRELADGRLHRLDQRDDQGVRAPSGAGLRPGPDEGVREPRGPAGVPGRPAVSPAGAPAGGRPAEGDLRRPSAAGPERPSGPSRPAALGGTPQPLERPLRGAPGGRPGGREVPGEAEARPQGARPGQGAQAGGLAGEPGRRPSLVEELGDEEAFESALAGAVGAETPVAEAPERTGAQVAAAGPRQPEPPERAPAASEAAAEAPASLEQADQDLIAAFRAELEGGGEQYSLGTFDPGLYDRVRDKITANIQAAVRAGKTLQEALVRIVDLLEKGLNMARAAAAAYVRAWREDWKAGRVSLEEHEVTRQDLPGAVKRPAERPAEAETEFQVAYSPRSQAPSVGTLVPRNMQRAITRTLEQIEAAVGPVDDFVATELGYESTAKMLESGHFSAEQVDALAMGIFNAQREAGIIIGDQTGVGKGRFVAAMMTWARRQGMTPIFFTRDPGLFGDIYRDLWDIGEREITPFVTDMNLKGANGIPIAEEYGGGEIRAETPRVYNQVVKKVLETGELPKKYSAVFTTYYQVQPTGRYEERRAFLNALTPNAFYVLDESHLAGGTGPNERASKEEKEKLGRAEWLREVLPNARGAVYSSATYAKTPTVMDLYMWTDMVQAVEKPAELGDAIAAGGVPLQQVVATMLTDAGQYVRREKSFDGVEFRREVIPVEVETAETVSMLLRELYLLDRQMEVMRKDFIDNLSGEGDLGIKDQSIGEAGVSSTTFAALMHNIVSQALLALKVNAGIERIDQSVKEGESVVVALSNTMASFLNNYMMDHGLKVGSDLGEFTFNEVFKRYWNKQRQVTRKDPVTEEKEIITIDEEEIAKYGGPQLLAEWKKLGKRIDETDLSSLSPAPIDKLTYELERRGVKVGEITGRSLAINYHQGGKVETRDDGKRARKQALIDFQNNRLDVLVINESGSTGLSAHAHPTRAVPAEKVRPRMMMVLQPHPNIDTFMQILGRINRTGQIKNPRFLLALADLPAETRPAAVLAKKMASLNANTTADRQSAVSDKEAVDFINDVGETVIRRIYMDDPELQDIIGVAPDTRRDIGPKITGRMILMPTKAQAEFYDRLAKEYRDEIDRLDKLDANPLVAKTLEIDARTKGSVEITPERDGDSLFAAPAVLELIDSKRLTKPPSADQVWERIVSHLKVESRDQVDFAAGLKAREIADRIDERAATFHSEAQAKALELLEQVEALRAQKKAAADGEAKAKLDEKIADAAGRAERHRAHAAGILERQRKLREALETNRVGVGIAFKVKEAIAYGRIVGVKHVGTAKDPTAFSNIQLSILLSDGTPTLDVPLSQIYGERGRFGIQLANFDAAGRSIDESFDHGTTLAREDRHIVTGNLLAGYAKYGREAQGIINFHDDKGHIRQGILMPRSFDPAKFEQSQPVRFATGDQVVKFLFGHDVLVESDDAMVQLGSATRRGDFAVVVRVRTRGGKLIENNREFRKLLADAGHPEGLQGRRGEKYRSAIVQPAYGRDIANFLIELGVDLQTKVDRERAAEITGQTDPLERLKPVVEPDEQYSVTERFREDSDEIRERILAIARRINPEVNVRFVNRMFGRGKALQDSGAKTTEEMEVAGSYRKLHRLVTVSLNRTRFDPEDAAYHELWHSLEELLTEREREILRRAFPATATVSHEERTAIAFARWARREQSIESSAIRRAFTKISNFLVRVGNMLRGRGFTSVRQVFSAAYRGEIGQKAALRRNPKVQEIPELRDDLVKAMGELGYNPATVLEMPIEEVRARLKDQVRYGIGDPGQRRRRRVFGTPEQEEIMRRLMVTDEDRPFWRQVRDYVGDKAHQLETEWRQGIFDWADSVARLEKRANRGRLRDAAQSAYKMALRTQNLRGVMISVLKAGPLRYDPNQGAFVIRDEYYGYRGGFEKIFEDLAAKGLMPKWKAWAIAVRANRLNREGRERLMGKIALELGWTSGTDENGNPVPDTQRAIDELLKLGGDPMDPNYKGPVEHAEFAEVHRHWQAFNRAMLDMAEQAGLINATQRAAWEKSDYVPFYRVLEDVAGVKTPGTRTRGLADQRPPIKELRGGESMVGDVVENMVLNMTYLTDASFKNEAMRRIRRLAVDAGAMEKVGNLEAKKALITAEGARKALAKIGIDTDAMSSAERRQILSTFQLVPPRRSDVVSLMIDGQAQYYRVKDPLLLRTLTSLNHKTLGSVMVMLRGTKRIYTDLVTADPAFMIRNLMRDTLQTKVVTGADLKFGAATLKGLKDAYSLDRDLLNIYAAGAGTGGFYRTAAADVRRHIESRLSDPNSVISIAEAGRWSRARVRGAWEQWQQIGFATENANRIAVYRAMRAKGATIAEAVHEAQDLLNFSQHGDWQLIEFLITTVPFFNARLQGLYRLGRAFFGERPGDKIVRYRVGGRTITVNMNTLMRGMILVAASIAYWGLVSDDERYQDLPDWEKDFYYHFWIGDQHIRLPKPFEVGALFSTMPERAMSAIAGDETWGDFAKAVGRMFYDTFAFNPTPQLARPVIESIANYHFFFDRPIETQADERVRPEERYDARTSETAIIIARLMPQFTPEGFRSPKSVEAFIRGYTAAIGGYLLAAVDNVSREVLDFGPEPARRGAMDIPIGRAFLPQGVPATRWTEEFYRLREETNKIAASLKRLQDYQEVDAAKELQLEDRAKLAYRRRLNRMARKLGKLRNLQARIYAAKDMEPAEKRRRIEEIRRQHNAIVKQTKRILEDIRKSEGKGP